MVYHFFDEREIFSEFEGGAISRWAANVLRDEQDTHIVCQKADDSWGFAADRVHIMPRLSEYMRYRARRFYPAWLNRILLDRLCGDDLPALAEGDVIWIHGQPAIAALLVPRVIRAKAKLVLHLHGSAFITHAKGLLSVVSRHAARVVFCSHFLESEAKGRFPHLQRSIILYNGADGSLFYPSTEGTRVRKPINVLFASRLVPEKGAHVLIEAMRILEKQGASMTATVCGAAFFGGSAPTPYMESLRNDLPANVEFVGYEHGKTLAERFRSSDIFCLPAVYEDPFPLVTLEAMASGLPVVASRKGGIQEAFLHGGAELIEPDHPKLLADTLHGLALDADKRRELSQAGRAAFERLFSWAIVRDKYREILGAL